MSITIDGNNAIPVSCCSSSCRAAALRFNINILPIFFVASISIAAHFALAAHPLSQYWHSVGIAKTQVRFPSDNAQPLVSKLSKMVLMEMETLVALALLVAMLLATIIIVAVFRQEYEVDRKINTKIDLPLETWTDIFEFVPRPQLVQLVGKIEDRQFASFIQFFLHKCGTITLGKLWIGIGWSRRIGEGPPIVLVNWQLHLSFSEMPLADMPMPTNVKDFKQIHLSYNIDQSIIGFLQQFQQNSLLTNVNLNFDEYTNINSNFGFLIMTNIVPLITSFNSINFLKVKNILPLLQNHSELAKPMLESARILLDKSNLSHDWYLDWLYAPREDAKPRVLYLDTHYNIHSILLFIKRIKKDFLDSKKAISFFIHLYFFQYAQNNVEDLILENKQTHEKLVIKANQAYDNRYGNYDVVTISRHPIEADEEWIKEMEKYDENYEYRTIIIG